MVNKYVRHSNSGIYRMDIAKAFEVAFNRKKEKNWEKIYVVVDIHDTILRACYENEETYDYYPYAREALQLMTNRDDICMILWSGCYDEQMAVYRNHFTHLSTASSPSANTLSAILPNIARHIAHTIES